MTATIATQYGDLDLADITGDEVRDGDAIDETSDDYDTCPKHKSAFRKIYTYGSSFTGETRVATYKQCRCAVATTYHPAFGDAHTTYHSTFGAASGVGALHREICRERYS